MIRYKQALKNYPGTRKKQSLDPSARCEYQPVRVGIGQNASARAHGNFLQIVHKRVCESAQIGEYRFDAYVNHT